MCVCVCQQPSTDVQGTKTPPGKKKSTLLTITELTEEALQPIFESQHGAARKQAWRASKRYVHAMGTQLTCFCLCVDLTMICELCCITMQDPTAASTSQQHPTAAAEQKTDVPKDRRPRHLPTRRVSQQACVLVWSCNRPAVHGR